MQHLVQRLLDSRLVHPLAAGLLQGLIALQIQPLERQIQTSLSQRQAVALVLQIEGRHLHLITAGEGLGIIPRQLGVGADPLQRELDALRQLQGEGGERHLAVGREPDAAYLGHVGAALEIRQGQIHLALRIVDRHAQPLEDHVAIAIEIPAIIPAQGQEAELVEPLPDLEVAGPETGAVAHGPEAAGRLQAKLPLLHAEGGEDGGQGPGRGIEQHVALDIERQQAAVDEQLQLDGVASRHLGIETRQRLGRHHYLEHAITGEQVLAGGQPGDLDAALLLGPHDLLPQDAVEGIARVPAGAQPTHHQCRSGSHGHCLFHLLSYS